jgi:outer membrane protein OmpA-like peptidoglycan-associated protein
MNIVYDRILPVSTVGIFGYTDDIGPDDFNLDLSNKRAKTVYDLIRKVKPQNKLSFEGVGEVKPIYSNLLPEGRFYNRTVQIILEREVK